MSKASRLLVLQLFLCAEYSNCSERVASLQGEPVVKKKYSLKQYKTRRNLKKSGEPSGGKASEGKDKIFVIQEHNASHLHFDFRIEVDGVLVSWAIPKGPSLDPDIKRLAAQTDDHPMNYANFEGVIKEGYGAGQVIVWDKGTYKNVRTISMKKSLDEGKVEIFLKGQKLQGAFALIKTHFKGAKNSWLFFKMKDEYADARRNIIKSEPESIISGKTIDDLAKEQDDVVRRPKTVSPKVSSTKKKVKKAKKSTSKVAK